MAQQQIKRPLVRAYGFVTGKSPEAIREVEKKVIRQKLSKKTLWIDPVGGKRVQHVDLDDVVVDTPVFAEVLTAYADEGLPSPGTLERAVS